ncbi:MAG: tape measure protein [Paludibacteraceae bacterium]
MASQTINYTINITGNANQALDSITETTKVLKKSINQTSNKLQGFLGSIIGIQGVISSVHSVANAFNGITQAGATAELQLMNLKTLYGGNAEAAEAMYDRISKYGKETPYDKKGLLDAQRTMMSFGISGEKAFETMKQIGDIAMGDKQKMQSLSLAFAQMSSTGKLTGQDLMQMINAGFNPLNEISKLTGKSVGVLKDEMSKGAVSADMVAQAFASATSEGGLFYNAIDQASQTTAAKMASIQDSIEEVKVKIAGATGDVGLWMSALSQAAVPLAELMPLLTGVGAAIKWCTKNWNGFVKNVKKGIVVAMFQLESLKFSIGATGGFFKALAVTAKVSCKAIGSAIKSIPVIGWILAAISAVMALAKLLWDKCEGFRRVVFGVWEVVKTGFSMVLNLIQPLLSKLWEYIKSCATYIMSIPSKIGEAFSIAWNFVVDTFTAAFDWILEKLGSIGSWIGEKIIQPMRDMFAGLWNFVKGILDRIVNFVGEIFNPIIELWNKLTGNVVNTYLRGAEKGSESWRKDQQEKLVPGFGINEQLQSAVGGTGTETATNKNSATGASTEAVATGGTRSTNVTITLKNLVEKIVFEGTTAENVGAIERNLAEAMLRVLNMAQSSIG